MEIDGRYDIMIERNENGNRIRIKGFQLDKGMVDFDKAYRLLVKLWKRTKEVDSQIEYELKMKNAKAITERLWKQVDGKTILDSRIDDNSRKIAFCLLRYYPDCKTQYYVASEIDVSRSTVRDQLNGTVESVREYFQSCIEGYTLSLKGIDWVLDEIIPSINFLNE